jgi:hypothetical protein
MRILCATVVEGLKCPVCGQPAMSREEKLDVNPRTFRKCAQCGTDLRASWASALAFMLPMAGMLIAVISINGSLPWWIASGLGVGLWFAAYRRYWPRTPLVIAKRS